MPWLCCFSRGVEAAGGSAVNIGRCGWFATGLRSSEPDLAIMRRREQRRGLDRSPSPPPPQYSCGSPSKQVLLPPSSKQAWFGRGFDLAPSVRRGRGFQSAMEHVPDIERTRSIAGVFWRGRPVPVRLPVADLPQRLASGDDLLRTGTSGMPPVARALCRLPHSLHSETPTRRLSVLMRSSRKG